MKFRTAAKALVVVGCFLVIIIVGGAFIAGWSGAAYTNMLKGTSMMPVTHPFDTDICVTTTDYGVGDVVVYGGNGTMDYWSNKTYIRHRIVGVYNESRWVMQGDNNSFKEIVSDSQIVCESKIQLPTHLVVEQIADPYM